LYRVLALFVSAFLWQLEYDVFACCEKANEPSSGVLIMSLVAGVLDLPSQ
jgi:hypothetical protein